MEKTFDVGEKMERLKELVKTLDALSASEKAFETCIIVETRRKKARLKKKRSRRVAEVWLFAAFLRSLHF